MPLHARKRQADWVDWSAWLLSLAAVAVLARAYAHARP